MHKSKKTGTLPNLAIAAPGYGHEREHETGQISALPSWSLAVPMNNHALQGISSKRTCCSGKGRAQVPPHFSEGGNHPSPADHFPFLLILDNEGGRREDAVEGGLCQAIGRVEIILRHRDAFSLQLPSYLLCSRTLRALGPREDFNGFHGLSFYTTGQMPTSEYPTRPRLTVSGRLTPLCEGLRDTLACDD